MNAYKTVAGETESVSVIERSKFICLIKGIEDETEAKDFIAAARKKYPLATHYCYAYIADEDGLNQKFSDDGEPHGTAGQPMLNALKSRGVSKTVAVVVRYFGGVKLGTGGLTRAYGGAVNAALDTADIRTLYTVEFYKLTLSYAQYKKFSGLSGDFRLNGVEYGDGVMVKVAVKKEKAETFLKKASDAFGGEYKAEKLGTGYFAF